MPTNALAYAQLADQTAQQITSSYQEWTAFLTTAARLYKYPYGDQIMIYAQRPDATACAEYDTWNNTMHRYVRRGSKGIALLDPGSKGLQIRYVFDQADTGGRVNSRSPFLWTIEDRHEQAVREMLGGVYDISPYLNLSAQLNHIAGQLASEYWQEHQKDIIGIVDGSYLAAYDEFNISASFRKAATASISYALQSRCGLEPESSFNHEDFMDVFDWNTPNALAAMGTAVSRINQQVLRQIEVTVKSIERSYENERTDLHQQWGLSDPGHRIEPTGYGISPIIFFK